MKLGRASPRLLDQPLLTHASVAALLRDGYHWSGNGAPWPIRETTFGRSGNLLSNIHGSGIDFAETRAYQPGDEPRHINWRATARSGKPMVRIFHDELAATSCFFLDRRSSMRFGTRVRLKATQLARLAIFLAAWESRRGAELGCLSMNDDLQWLSPRSGESGTSQVIRSVIQPCPPLDERSMPPLQHSLSRMAEQLPGGSHVYLISDFLDLDDELKPLLHRLGKHHRVWAIQVFDTAEQHLPAAGILQLVWGTRTSPPAINTSSSATRLHYEQLFQHHHKRIADLFAMADISFSSIATDANDLALALGG